MPDLDPGELGAEARAEVIEAPRLAEDAVEARPVSADEASRMRLAQERPQPARAREERLDPVPREVAAGKRRARGPGRPRHEKIRDLFHRPLGAPPIRPALAAATTHHHRPPSRPI